MTSELGDGDSLPHDCVAVAIVLAGGVGVRFGDESPKQFARLAGMSILERTLRALDQHPILDGVVVVANEDHMSLTRSVCARAVHQTPWTVVAGGRTRNESTWAGLEALGESDRKVLVHDAVRPFVSHAVIDRCLDALERAVAVDTVIRSADTIVEVDAGRVARIPDRSRLRRGQTPQGFRLPMIRAAYEKAFELGFPDVTDDCSVLLWADPSAHIAAVDGDERNVKITTALDLDVADRILQAEGSPLDEAGPNLGGRNVAVIGGSSGIGLAVVDAVAAAGGTALPASRSLNGVDVRDPESVSSFLADAAAGGKPVTDVVLTAGELVVQALVESDLDVMRRIVDVNLWGPLMVARCAFPWLEQAQGNLLLFTSSSFTRGRASYALYSATKAAVANLAQGLAEEWAQAGVRVNVISPGRTLTPMRVQAFGEEAPGSLLDAKHVAERTVVALSSPLTGQVFHVRQEGSS